ncbi:Fc.00g089210.m01.CDS01 [Cosmosporella sp. VM-42]
MAGPNALRPTAGRILQSCSASRSCLLPQGASGTSRIAQFSTTAPQCKRKTKDNNKVRGVSSLYRSGPREPLSMSNVPLPKPRDFKPKVATDDNHGLWGFFPEKGKVLATPKETEEHGRAWAVEELRKKSWEDLHALWWVCCRERNMLATSKVELERSKMGFGEREIDSRDEQVQKTQRSIKHVLTERFYTWQDAVDVAMSDPEINLEGGDGQVYNPSAYEDEAGDPAWAQAEAEAEAEAAKEETTTLKADPALTEEQPVKVEKEITR